MIKTVLITPPLTLEERMGMLAEGGAVMPTLGILYIASFIKKQGFPVEIIDTEGLKMDIESAVQAIAEQNPDVLGITTTTVSIISAVKLAKEIKNKIPRIKIFLGGPHVTAVPKETMEDFTVIDGSILGDGEYSFLKVIQNIRDGIDFQQEVEGFAWRKNNENIINPKKGHLNDLDLLPFPAWNILRGFPEIYRPSFHSYRRLPVANIITTRGCPYACAFCDRSVFGQKMHGHSIDYIIEMIRYLIKDFGVKEISIKDDMFVIKQERVFEFCRQLREKKIDISWSCNARVDNVNNEVLKEMRKAGCWMISYGIESGSSKMLKKMVKGISKDHILNALRLSRKNGIVTKGFFMIGIPGETVKTMKDTLQFIKKLPLDELNINCFTPFPGSKFYLEAIAEGFQPDFSRMNLINTVYITKGLTENDLSNYQKKIIRSFYFKPSKIAWYILRALNSIDEFKRIYRMGKMSISVLLSGLKKKKRM